MDQVLDCRRAANEVVKIRVRFKEEREADQAAGPRFLRQEARASTPVLAEEKQRSLRRRADRDRQDQWGRGWR